MLRKLGFLIAAFGLVLPVHAADRSASVSGYVRDANGVPQMGALVEVLGSAFHSLKIFTDEKGFYSASGVLPGIYSIKVSAPAFLPALREHVGLRSGGTAIVNVTLNTIFEAIQLGPVRDSQDQDDWKWVLRTANRPVLRIFNGYPVTVAEANQNVRDLKGTVSFVAGSGQAGYGSSSDMSTGFRLEKSIFSAGTVAFTGNVGYGDTLPTGVVRASYRHKLSNGSEPQIGLTMRKLASAYANLPNSSLQALALTASNNVNLGDVLELRFGSELQTIQFMGHVTAFRPFGSADFHLSPNTVVEYAYSSSEPNSRDEKGFDTAPADFSESGPRVSTLRFAPALEHAHHQEVSLSHRLNNTNLQVAFYSDRIVDPALTGVGTFAVSGDALPDPYSGTFTYRAGNLDARGIRLVLQRKIASDLKATIDYEFGGVLDLDQKEAGLENVSAAMHVQQRQSIAGKIAGSVPKCKTQWIASYRWINGEALTPVDMFNASPGQADPFLNIFVRQPIPGTGSLPGHMEAIIDLRNLLAQGYVPVMGQDGRTVYLVQSARTVRGGLAFSF